MQQNLFENAVTVRLKRGRERQRQGLEKVGRNNDAMLRACRVWAQERCLSHGSVTIMDVRDWATSMGFEPTHPNAWGAVFKSPGFYESGYTTNGIASAHARRVLVWKWHP